LYDQTKLTMIAAVILFILAYSPSKAQTVPATCNVTQTWKCIEPANISTPENSFIVPNNSCYFYKYNKNNCSYCDYYANDIFESSVTSYTETPNGLRVAEADALTCTWCCSTCPAGTFFCVR